MSVDAKISKHEFFFELGLYKVINNDQLEDEIFDGNVDGYSQSLSQGTTYDIKCKNLLNFGYDYDYEDFYIVKLKCKRTDNDLIRYFIYQDEKVTIKLGQDPSLADIQFAEMNKKYDKVLDRESLVLFKKAVGLYSHGTGAGSFVYLRRIFEKLIKDVFAENQNTLKITSSDFQNKRMSDKIKLLKDCLPEQLARLSPLYGILSQGVHELSEEECLEFFPTLKLAIELILDEKIDKEKKKARKAEVEKQLNLINQNLKQPSKVKYGK